jgi:hypothetical protein
MLKLNAMKRFFKWMAVGVFIFFVAVIGLGFWLRHQYPPERIRRMAGDWLGARLGRQVEIADAKLSLLRGVELNGIRISEAPAFSAGTFIEARRVRVLPRILPLLSHQIIVRSIEVERPRATVRRSGEGLFNFSDLLSTGTVSETSGLTPPRAFALRQGILVNVPYFPRHPLRGRDHLRGGGPVFDRGPSFLGCTDFGIFFHGPLRPQSKDGSQREPGSFLLERPLVVPGPRVSPRRQTDHILKTFISDWAILLLNWPEF